MGLHVLEFEEYCMSASSSKDSVWWKFSFIVYSAQEMKDIRTVVWRDGEEFVF